VENRRVNLVPPALNEVVPRRSLPFAERGVRKVHEAAPRVLLPEPRTCAPPTVALHAMPLGATGLPSAVTRTVAAKAAPARGFAGASATEPVVTLGKTTTVTALESFDATVSGGDDSMIRAFSVYVPGWAATMSQAQPKSLRPTSGSSGGLWHSTADAVLVQPSLGSRKSEPHERPRGSSNPIRARAGSGAISDTLTPATNFDPVTLAVPPFGTVGGGWLNVATVPGPAWMSSWMSTAAVRPIGRSRFQHAPLVRTRA
jgi:hypothetical protein